MTKNGVYSICNQYVFLFEMRYCHLTRTIVNHSDAIVLSNVMQSLRKKIVSLLRQDILS